MKKKILALLAGTMVIASLLAGCGNSAPAAEERPENSSRTLSTEDEMCSDETFEELQENYKIVVECYDSVEELYMSDEIAQSDEVEDLLFEANDIIEEMGEIEQSELTEKDADELNDAMEDIIEALNGIVDSMELVDGPCSDETFAELQENYEIVVDCYNSVEDLYMSDSIAQSDEVEDCLFQANELIEEIGEIEQSELTESDADELNAAMLTIIDGLNSIVDSMDIVCMDDTYEELGDTVLRVLDDERTVEDYYYNTPSVPQNNYYEDVFFDACSLIDEIYQIDQYDLTESQAWDYIDQLNEMDTLLWDIYYEM